MQGDNQARWAAWVGAAANVVLMIGKGVIGLLAGSQALFADAIHSAADVVGSLAVIIGLRIARKPPDEDHPYGHGKAELISSAIVALFLLGAGVEVAVSSLKSLFEVPHPPAMLAAWTAFAAIIVKEALFQYTMRLGHKLRSKSLVASAYDHRSDVFSSIAAFVGILLSEIGRSLGIRWLQHMDSAAGILVALLVLRIGYQIVQDSVQTLMDRTAPVKDLQVYAECIEATSGVRRIDDLRVRDHGQYVIVDVEISVDADITVAAGHDIAAQVKHDLEQEFVRVSDVLVHVNPFYITQEAHRDSTD